MKKLCRDASCLSPLLLFVYFSTLLTYTVPLHGFSCFYTCLGYFLSLIFTAESTEYGKSATALVL